MNNIKIKTNEGFNLKGLYTIKCHNKDGDLKWATAGYNMVVNEGIDHVLDSTLANGTQEVAWYLFLKSTGAADATDTMSSPINWTENTSYAGDRKVCSFAAASSKSTTNTASPAVFTMNATFDIYGIGLTSDATGTAGVLFSVIDFDDHRAGGATDAITVTYTVSGADS